MHFNALYFRYKRVKHYGLNCEQEAQLLLGWPTVLPQSYKKPSCCYGWPTVLPH